MLPSLLSAAVVSSILLARPAAAAYNADHPYRPLVRRSDISQDPSKLNGKNFDFVVIGGGVAGLAIAARLSENKDFTVAVIEAGGDGSEPDIHDKIYIPGYSYLNGLTVSDYDWDYRTVQQSEVDGKSTTFENRWPRGKGLGGSGAINGLFWCRASKPEYDAWNDLNPNGEEDWSFDELQRYMMKSETFHPPTQEQQDTFHIQYDTSVHGQDGPIQVGYPYFIYDSVKHWIPAYEALGVPVPKDGASGNNRGPVITPSTINLANMSRSDPKAGYIDPIGQRDNLVILTNHLATKINWKGDKNGDKLVAESVEFGKSKDELYTVYVNKEVIMAGGTVNTPQTLQLSGVGPRSLLEGLGIEVRAESPGVGHNLQDHAATAVYFKSNVAETWFELKDAGLADSELGKWRQNGQSKWSFINQAIGYPAAQDIMKDVQGFVNNVNSQLDAYVGKVQQMYGENPTVIQGMRKQWDITANKFLNSEVGQLEILMTMLGGGPYEMGFQVALQHPFSRGTILINSADPFTPPEINPGYLTNHADVEILRAGVRFAIALSKAGEMGDYIAEQLNYQDQSDEAIDAQIRSDAHTEFHPVGTAAMLPQEDGGVVDTRLLVYGTSNVRIVDASVMPLELSAHLMATTYGIAEKAADIIKAQYGQNGAATARRHTARRKRSGNRQI